MKSFIIPCNSALAGITGMQNLHPTIKELITGLVIETLIDFGQKYKDDFIEQLQISDMHRQEYLDSIDVSRHGDDVIITFTPLSWVVGALEDGHGGYDIKKMLLDSPKARIGSKGKFRDIPLKKDAHLLSTNPFNITDPSLDKIRESLKSKLNKIIRANKTPEDLLEGSSRYDYQSEYYDVASAPIAVTKVERVRTYIKNTDVAVNEKFVDWVRISENDRNTWWHPGFLAARLCDTMAAFLNQNLITITQELQRELEVFQ